MFFTVLVKLHCWTDSVEYCVTIHTFCDAVRIMVVASVELFDVVLEMCLIQR